VGYFGQLQLFHDQSRNGLIWIVMSVYVLIAILRRRLSLDYLTLWQISQVLSLTSVEKTRVNSLFLYEKKNSSRRSGYL